MSGVVSSRVRNFVNQSSRSLLKESTRKMLVENFYAAKASKINRNSPVADHMGEDLVDWRKTLSYRIQCSRGVYRGNCFYGAARWMQEYAGTKNSVKACIEHGVYFGNYVNDRELDGSCLPALITYGPARMNHVKDVSKTPVCMVGPYIAYAPDYLSGAEATKIKSKLGRTLLVFPSHSVDRVKVEFEMKGLFDAINRMVNEYGIDTVLISLYYRDLLDGAADPYEALGYTVVSSGYREDSLFLPRQRSLIKLADYTMSNNVGTHVGYCAYLGKPHWVYGQEKRYRAVSAVDASEFDNPYVDLQAKEKGEVEQAFAKLSEEVTNQQRSVCERYWGFGKVKTPSEMSRILSACGEAYIARPDNRQEKMRQIIERDELEGLVG